MVFTVCKFPFSLVVRIPGSHPGGPGSIPGMGIFFVLVKELHTYISYQRTNNNNNTREILINYYYKYTCVCVHTYFIIIRQESSNSDLFS